MQKTVLIAHASGEEGLVEKLADPIRETGYEVVHSGTVMVGDSLVQEASKLLSEGAPVILCGTVKAMGTKWARQVVNAARRHDGVRVFVVQMEEDADVESISFDQVIARYWFDSNRAIEEIRAALHKHYPLGTDSAGLLKRTDLEARYRDQTLMACDIIDLANLPEDDRHLVTRELELRRLYVALRMRIEVSANAKNDDVSLQALVARRQSSWARNLASRSNTNGTVSLGERLSKSRYLVVLGDPGSGKSTLLRWLATAYLLRLMHDPDWKDLPDISTLPDEEWVPILIRCRDLPTGVSSLGDMLRYTLRKNEFPDSDCERLIELLREKLHHGSALLLIDGLDEIANPPARARFSQQIETIHTSYPRAHIVVTSRIVGYREMGYRLGSSFEHLSVSDLTPRDKDDFANRWCSLVERPERRSQATKELINDIHSSDRIERLTGNPMLLTTMALIKRKVGKLPQRRVDLYEKTVEVLLNWRSAVDLALDRREALPQLEYIAHAMCARGVQQLTEDEILDLLIKVRVDYPRIYPMTQHTPHEFLALLEARTGLLVQSGHMKKNGLSTPVYEFRHLTIQEYLAGIALVQGHFQDFDPTKSLADTVGPLAGARPEPVTRADSGGNKSWTEALRLCVAAAPDKDVDQVMQAIASVAENESDGGRARAALTALCLADEPNISAPLAESLIFRFVKKLSRKDFSRAGKVKAVVGAAAAELARSRWRKELVDCLWKLYFDNKASQRPTYAVFAGTIASAHLTSDAVIDTWLLECSQSIENWSPLQSAAAAFTLIAVSGKLRGRYIPPELASYLVRNINNDAHLSFAFVWACETLAKHGVWAPTGEQVSSLISLLDRRLHNGANDARLLRILARANDASANECLLRYARESGPDLQLTAIHGLGLIRSPVSAQPLIQLMSDVQYAMHLRLESLNSLAKLSDATAQAAVLSMLENDNIQIRTGALESLARALTDKISKRLLRKNYRQTGPVIDPIDPITEDRVALAASRLKLDENDVRRRYELLARKLHLKLRLDEAATQ